jgi:deoxyribose-phosphate aldolase
MSTQISELTEASKLAGGIKTDWRSVAALIDQTLLKPEVSRQQVERLCEEAVQYGFACVFVNPSYTALAACLLAGTAVKVGAPVGSPLGASLTTIKRQEAFDAIRLGAQEIDMVMNIGALKSADRGLVLADLKAVAEVVHAADAVFKVIIETSLLTLEEKIVACELSLKAGADFVKTSTGFNGGGATVDDVALMRGVVGQRAGVKASGGIRSANDALAMIQAGASRIGSSCGIEIIRELGAPSY